MANDESKPRVVRSYRKRRETEPIDGRNIGKPFKEAVINNADLGAGSYAVLRDPYTFAMKVRFEEAYRTDPVIRAAINKKTSFVLGKKLDTIFDLVDSFLNPSEGRAALSILMTDQEYTNAKRIIDRVNRKVNFQQKLKSAFIQSKVYGRSALLVEAPPDGLPVNIKVLSSKLLGQVRIDEKSWQLQQVQYNTNSRGLNDPYNFLQADDIIYFTNCDYHVSPYTIFYGLSDIEPVAHISETNRILNEEDFKEMNYSAWSGFGLLKIPTIRNSAEITSFLNNFKPGRWTAISQDITAEVVELQKDLASLLTERNENEKLILRQLAVPAAILGFEDIQNFACLDQTTETLTENGWKHYDEIGQHERIATVSPDTFELEYHVPTGPFVYDYDGELIRFETENQDFLVTPNHRTWMTHDGVNWHRREAQHIENMSKFAFLASVTWNEQSEIETADVPAVEYSRFGAYSGRTTQIQSVKMDDWLRFLGFYISEGSILTKPYRRQDRPDLRNPQYGNTITLVQNTCGAKNGVNVCNEIDSCLQKIPFKFHSYIEAKRKHKHWQLQSKQLHTYLRQFGEHAHDKHIPRWILALGKRQLKILFDSMILGDGSFNKSGNALEYFTTSKQLADDVQELALKLGYHAWIKGPYVDKRTDYKRHTSYHVNISWRRNKLTWINRRNISRQYYKGKVYCFNVKNHLFVVRRNGKIGVTHNTLQEVLSAWKESEIEEQRSWINSIVEPQWFDKLMCQILSIDDPDELKAKVMFAFEDIALENLKDKALAVIPLYEAGILPADRVLEYLGFDDVADQVKMIQSKKEKANQQMQQIQQESGGGGEPQPTAADLPPSNATSLLNEVQRGQNVPPAPKALPGEDRPQK